MAAMRFSKPPINEVICGIQFNSSSFDFRIQDQFFEMIKGKYPNIRENPPLPIIFDRGSLSAPPPNTRVPLIRHFFISDDQSKLLQLQDGRFLFNWRKVEEKHAYPKFDAVFDEFMGHWDVLNEVSKKIGAEVLPNQLELTYIDHIQKTDFGNTWGLEKIFTFFAKTPATAIDDLLFRFGVPVTELNGHLTITSQLGQRNIDRKELLILDSTLRGINRNISISDWFKKAHDTIYASFMESITDEAKKVWGCSL